MNLKLLKFSANWCNPCKLQKKEFELHPINIDTQEIDIENATPEESALIQKYKVRSLPTIIIIDGTGEVKTKFIGYTRSSKIKEAIISLNNN